LIIVTNEITKAFVSLVIRSKKLIKLWRNGIEIGRFDFALITAYAKPRISFRRVGEALIQPKKGIAESALNIHSFKIMNNPSTTERMACRRNILSCQRLWWWWWWL